MNQNEGYSNNRRRNQRRNDRSRNERNGRNSERRNVKEEHSQKNERQGRNRERDSKRKNHKESSLKNQRSSQQREFQTEIQKTLQKEFIENELAIRSFRSTMKICEICGQPISATDIGSAVSNKTTENPAHFDCVLNQVVNQEKLGQNEKVTYIGQGRFAVLYFDNINDLRHFSIRRIIEWENRDNRLAWRDEMAKLFSQVK